MGHMFGSKPIDITRPHKISYDAARRKAEAIASQMRAEYGIDWHWEASTIHFKGAGKSAGVRGYLVVATDSVRLHLNLPLLLTALTRTIHERCDEYLRALERSEP